MSSSKKYSNGFWKVYVHTNLLNGKKYVGITSQKPEYRWCNGKGYGHSKHFQSAINKYGWDAFEHEVLYDYLSEAEAKAKEQELISLWKTQDREYGYNTTAGGEGATGFVPSEELRKRWSEMRKGTKRSEETKRKMAEAGRRTYEKSRIPLAEAKYRPVNMYDLDGVFLQRFNSLIEAKDAIGYKGTHIGDVCRGKRKSCAGYLWQYA